MLWDKWIPEKYLVKPEVCSLELCFTDEKKQYFHAFLKQNGKKLELLETGSSEEISSLPPRVLKMKIPVILILNGKGIILKKIDLDPEQEKDIEVILKQNLPSVHQDDFYVQIYKQADHSAFIAVCRKEQLDSVLDELKTRKYDLAGVLLGAPSILGLQPLWSDFKEIESSIQRAEIKDGLLYSVTPLVPGKTSVVRIEDISFNSEYSLAFAGGLSYLMRRRISENGSAALNLLEEHHLKKNKLRFSAMIAAAIAFLFSISNVFLYTSCFDKNNRLETELSVYQGKYEQINQLLAEYQKNKNLIENSGLLNRNKLSEYADRIGKTLPDEVILSDLYLHPVKEEEASGDSLMTFRSKSMVLKGFCTKSFIINEWINVLKMQKFVKEVSLEKFVYNNQGLAPNFEIKLLTE